MKFLPLIWAGLWRKPVRTTLTMLCLVTAFMLFGLLRSVDAGFDTRIAAARLDRLIVLPRFGGSMPLAYTDQISKVEGVASVSYLFFARGFSRDPKMPFFVAGGSANMYDYYDDLGATPPLLETLKAKANGLVLTPTMAARLGGAKVGDHIPLHSEAVRQKDGSPDWDFEVVGIVDNKEVPGIYTYSFGNFDYINEARADPKNVVQQFLIRITDSERALEVARGIDARFLNSGVPTLTVVQRLGEQAGAASLGNVKLITLGVLAVVLFVLLLLTASTLAQSVDERKAEFATLKTLGFSNRAVFNIVLTETLIQCVAGAAIGMLAAAEISPLMQGHVPVPLYRMPLSVFLMGLATAIVIAVLTTAIPGLRASRLQIVDALTKR